MDSVRETSCPGITTTLPHNCEYTDKEEKVMKLC